MKTTDIIILEEKLRHSEWTAEYHKKMYYFWFDIFNDKYPEEMHEIMGSEEYKKLSELKPNKP